MLLDILSALCLLTGSLLALIGAIGIHRFPEFYSRLHAAGVTDTLGAALILLGLLLQSDSFAVVAKLVLVLLFLLFTSPTATHVLAKTAMRGGFLPPGTGSNTR